MFRRSPILITGAPRSGTSLTAGLFARAGVWTGECHPPSKNQPCGYFENMRLGQVFWEWTKDRFGWSHKDAECYPVLGFHRVQTIVRRLQVEVPLALREEGYDDGPWMFKLPSLVSMWVPVSQVFPDAQWVVVTRRRERVLESMARNWGGDAGEYDALLARYEADMKALRRSRLDVFTVDADNLVEGKCFVSVEQVLGRFQIWADERLEKKWRGFVRKEHWHG